MCRLVINTTRAKPNPLEAMAAASRGSVKLPCIIHPSKRNLSADINALQLTGTGTSTAMGGKSRPRVRPATVPRYLSVTRPESSQLSTDELIDALSNKLRGNGFFTLKSIFNAFDHENKGYVSKDALYRIVCNILNGITRAQFNALLLKLHLDNKRAIKFSEFYKCFCMIPTEEPHWLEKITHHGPRPMEAEFVHSMLLARAQQCSDHLADFLPQWNGLQGTITSIEFRRILASLSFTLNDGEFNKLWLKYDPCGKGKITGQHLLEKLGMKFDETIVAQSKPHPLSPQPPDTVINVDGSDNVDEAINVLSNNLKDKSVKLSESFKKLDPTNAGKLSTDQILKCFHEVDVPLTREQCHHVLTRLGHAPNKMIHYKLLLDTLSSLSSHSFTNAVLTDTTQKFYVPKTGRACVSTADAESRIVCTLQKNFLLLLARLRSHDPDGSGYLSRDTFFKSIDGLLPEECKEAFEKLTDKLQDEATGLIMYPQFLGLFDGPIQPAEHHVAEVTKNDEGIIRSKSEEVCQKLSKLCKADPERVMAAYEDQDPGNTSRISKTMFQQILFRLGFLHTEDDIVGHIWSKLLKNKDGSVDPHELIRHFTEPLLKHNKSAHKLFTEDHKFKRSRLLHRDEDMIMGHLKVIFTLYRGPIALFFKYHDCSNSGMIPCRVFNHLLLMLCPQLKANELKYLVSTFQDPDTKLINYDALLNSLPVQQPLHCRGNDLSTLLAQPTHLTISLPKICNKVSSPPQHGIPGNKVQLQKQLVQRWSELRRQLLKLDPSGSGLISIKMFRSLLKKYNISFSREEMFHILEELDPLLTGSINYSRFFQLVMEHDKYNTE